MGSLRGAVAVEKTGPTSGPRWSAGETRAAWATRAERGERLAVESLARGPALARERATRVWRDGLQRWALRLTG